MIKISDNLIAISVAFILTFSCILYLSRSVFGFAFALFFGILSIIITRFVLQGRGAFFTIVSQFWKEKYLYKVVVVIYVLSLFVLFSIHAFGIVPSALLYWQDWIAIPLQEYFFLLITITVLFFFPGYLILDLIDRDQAISGLDKFVFSFIVSWFFTPLICLISLFVFSEISVFFYLSFSLIVILTCIILRAKHPRKIILENKPLRVDLILFIIVLSFIVATFAFSIDYGYILGLDVWRHQGSALAISRYGLNAVQIPLNWFHIGSACVYQISSFPIVNTASALNFLNVMPLLAFYCMAKKIFGGRRFVASLGTAFFSVFSGFGWIYALNNMQNGSLVTALGHIGSIAANDTIFSNLWIWGNSPSSVSFTAFFMLFYVLFATDTFKRKSVIFTIVFLTFLTAWALHISEALFFVIMFGILAVFIPSISRTTKALFFGALGVGLVATLIIIPLSPGVTFFSQGSSVSLILLLYLALAAIVTFYSGKVIVLMKIEKLIKKVSNLVLNRARYFFLIVIFLWLFSFFIFSQEELTLSNYTSMLSRIGFVPWYVYSIRLGITGLFAILAFLFKDQIQLMFKKESRYFFAFLILSLAFFVFGNSITIVKVFYSPIDYWEIRILRLFLQATISIPAALFTLYLLNMVRQHFNHLTVRKVLKKRILSIKMLVGIALAAIVIIGTMSTVFTIHYWSLQPRNDIAGDLEFSTSSLQDNSVFSDKNSMFIANSGPSTNLLDSLGMQRVSDPMNTAILSATNAETYYFGTWFTQANHFLYMPETANSYFKSNPTSYMYTEIFNRFDNANPTLVYNLPYGVPSSTDSDLLFLTPDEAYPYNNVLNALAASNRTYDVALSDCYTNLDYQKIVLPYDPVSSDLTNVLLEKAEAGATLVVFNLGSAGNIADAINLSQKEDVLSLEDSSWTITYGTGTANIAESAGNSPILSLNGKSDNSGLFRCEYSFLKPWNMSNVDSLLFKFKNEVAQEVRFVLLDTDGNWCGFMGQYDNAGSWQTIRFSLDSPTDQTNVVNLSSINRIRLGINSNPDEPCNFSVSEFKVVPKEVTTTSDSTSYQSNLLSFSSDVQVPVLNSNESLAFYQYNGLPVSSFIIQKNYGAGQIVYVNASPLANAESPILLESINWVTTIANLTENTYTREEANQQFEMYAGKLDFQGQIMLNSTSIKFISGSGIALNTSKYSAPLFSVIADHITIIPSKYGTYCQASVLGTFELQIYDNLALTDSFLIQTNGTTSILMKSVGINASGNITFGDEYSRKISGYWGTTVQAEGNMSCTIRYSGKYLFIFDFEQSNLSINVTGNSSYSVAYLQLENISFVIYASISFIVTLGIYKLLRRKQIA